MRLTGYDNNLIHRSIYANLGEVKESIASQLDGSQLKPGKLYEPTSSKISPAWKLSVRRSLGLRASYRAAFIWRLGGIIAGLLSSRYRFCQSVCQDPLTLPHVTVKRDREI